MRKEGIPFHSLEWNWSREAFQRETLEKTGKYSAYHSKVFNYSQTSEASLLEEWLRKTDHNPHVSEIRDLQAHIAILLLK